VVAVRARKNANEAAGLVRTYGPEDLETMLREADYVILAAPVTSQTTGLMNAERIAAMKRDAYLINVSRGALVDEAALTTALQQHQIAGAALDVFEQEPLPANSPLWVVENLLITPHSAGLTGRIWERHYDLFSENMRRFLTGAPLLGLVDKSRGY
jgi:phosphoglycerate dehydrogenase-like enzyme